MRLEKMDDLLLEINSLKNIRSIKISDLSITTNTKIKVLPNIIVFYDNMKCINLCINDAYFYELLRKAKSLYLEEKEIVDIYSDPFHNKQKIKIEIDPLTRKLLEDSNLYELEELYNIYDPDKSYDESLLFTNDEINTILPIVKYNIKSTLKQLGKVIVFDNKKDGYMNKCLLNTSIDGLFRKIYIELDKKDFNEYEVTISNLFNFTQQLKINIKFENESIIIKNSIEDLDYTSIYEYKINNKEIIEIQSTHIKGELVSYSDRVLDKTDNEYLNITEFGLTDDMDWYKLPWNGIYGFNKKSEQISTKEKIDYVHSNYVSIFDKGFVSRNMISKIYKKDIGAYDYLKIELENVERVNTGINMNDKVWIIESKFNDKGTNGYYKTYLGGKHFYYTCPYKDIKEINTNELVELDKDNCEVFDKADLLRESKILRIARKGMGE